MDIQTWLRECVNPVVNERQEQNERILRPLYTKAIQNLKAWFDVANSVEYAEFIENFAPISVTSRPSEELNRLLPKLPYPHMPQAEPYFQAAGLNKCIISAEKGQLVVTAGRRKEAFVDPGSLIDTKYLPMFAETDVSCLKAAIQKRLQAAKITIDKECE
jgi:hypothetical protein